jgi:hypothetical protein
MTIAQYQLTPEQLKNHEANLEALNMKTATVFDPVDDVTVTIELKSGDLETDIDAASKELLQMQVKAGQVLIPDDEVLRDEAIHRLCREQEVDSIER